MWSGHWTANREGRPIACFLLFFERIYGKMDADRTKAFDINTAEGNRETK